MTSAQRHGRAGFWILAAVAALVTAACIYDPGRRCGAAEVYVAAFNACVCESNAVEIVGGCKLCAADEVVANGACACAAGETKNASNVCAVVDGLGDACDTATAPCSDPVYSYCATSGSTTAGTCTKSCSSDTDCDAAYTCAIWEPQPYCRTFDGAGVTCASSDDCHGDATFCDTYFTHTCIVPNCSVTENDCPRGLTCCDFSAYGFPTLCAGACQ